MPTYEYKCTSCGKNFEYFQKMSDSPLEKCEECDGNLKKLISGGVGPIFKGTGFYQTDYKNNGKKESKPETKTETKKEVKTDTTAQSGKN